jgi:hypothetical protein
MPFEQVARVFFDNGIEVFVCRCEGVEGVGAEGGVQVWLGVGEDIKKYFWGKSLELRHVGDLAELLVSWWEYVERLRISDISLPSFSYLRVLARLTQHPLMWSSVNPFES